MVKTDVLDVFLKQETMSINHPQSLVKRFHRENPSFS